MFRIVCDPSSGSIELYLTEIIRSDSQMFILCLVGVWQRNFEPVECVCVCLCVCTVRRVGNYCSSQSDQAHDKHQLTTTNNFSQAQLYTPWWWITHDPKHVGVIFNFMSFKIL